MEPLATQYCQKFDDFNMVIDLLEYKAKQNGTKSNNKVECQHLTLNIAEGFNSQLTNSQSQALAENNSTFNTQNS